MHITLSCTKEEKLELSIESDSNQSNPTWVVSWVDEHMRSMYEGGALFNQAQGRIIIRGDSAVFNQMQGNVLVQGELIKDFLENLINPEHKTQISTNLVTQNPDGSYFAISSRKQAERVYSIIKNLSLSNRFTKEQFNNLIDVSIVDFKGLNAKEQFARAYNCLYHPSTCFFGQNLSIDDLELNDIVKEAKSKEGTFRDVFVHLKWMDKEGSFTDNAPQEVVDAHSSNKNIPDLSAPQA
ncbi:hypothetical protein ACQUW5_03800 [Legionella sp. CNM-1927-20]|uniref:hypothetical protein n=1 Tax=Legionella sp. CNM-1927-20 TaxID=3422221 RepID=UPI00403B35EA